MSAMKKKVLVTAALPYSNNRPHVGHVAGCYLSADTYVRYLRSKGVDVRFVCGSDDHGVAIMLTAQKEGKSPADVAHYYNAKQQEAFASLGIHFDVYGATSRTKFHKKASQDFFLSMEKKGFFEKQRSRQFFDEKRQMFLPDRFVRGVCGYCGTPDQNGDQCEECGKVLDVDTLKDAVSVFSGERATVRETVHWFLDLSRFEGLVEEWLGAATLRDHTRSYVKGLLGSGLVKRSMTRDLEWGVPVPLDDPEARGKALYVWFDAPIGYISNTMELCEVRDGSAEQFRTWWSSEETDIYHFIGEDNTIFHCVIWIAMLSAEGSFRLPKGVIVNQFLNIKFPGTEEQKMSKSRGTAVWIEDLVSQGVPADSIRYYLTMVAPEKARAAYKPDDLVQRHNSELADVLGNFVNRVLSFSLKHVGTRVPKLYESKGGDVDAKFRQATEAISGKVGELVERFEFKAGLEAAMEYVRACNKYIDDKKPWATRKEDMEATEHTLRHAIEGIRTLAVVLSPYIPNSADRIAHMLNLSAEQRQWSAANRRLSDAHELHHAEILFQKIVDEPVS